MAVNDDTGFVFSYRVREIKRSAVDTIQTSKMDELFSFSACALVEITSPMTLMTLTPVRRSSVKWTLEILADRVATTVG